MKAATTSKTICRDVSFFQDGSKGNPEPYRAYEHDADRDPCLCKDYWPRLVKRRVKITQDKLLHGVLNLVYL